MNSYYYLDATNQRQGPLDGNLLPSKGVTAQTLVWTQGMSQWQAAGTVAELQPLFGGAQPSAAEAPAANQSYQQPAPQQSGAQYQQPMNQYQGNQYAQNQQPQPAGGFQAKPDNFLIWAILVTICCCWPLGVVAIYHAGRVNAYFEAGNTMRAVQESAEAKKWTIIAAAASILWYGSIFAFYASILGSLASLGGY